MAVRRITVRSPGWVAACRGRAPSLLARRMSREEFFKRCLELVPISSFAFPYHAHAPACFFQETDVGTVSFDVPVQFLVPVIHIRVGPIASSAACVPMPEAAVNEDDLALGRKHQIGMSRQLGRVKTIAISERKRRPPYRQFRAGVLRFHRSHGLASSHVSMDVRSPKYGLGPPFSRVFVAKSRRRRQGKARARRAPEAYLKVRRGARPRLIRREERAATRPARGTRRRTRHWRMYTALQQTTREKGGFVWQNAREAQD